MKALNYLLNKIKNGKIVYDETIKGLILCLIQDTKYIQLSSSDGALLFSINDRDLIEEYISRNPLSDELQLQLLQRDDAYYLFQKLPLDCRFFCEDAEIMMLKHKDAALFVKDYIVSSSLSPKAEPLLFDLKDAKNLILSYASKYNFISPVSQVKFLQSDFTYDELATLIRETDDSLCELAEIEMTKHPYATELLLLYIENNPLSDNALIEVFKLKDAYKIIEAYLKHGWIINNQIQLKLFEMNNYLKLFELYAKNEVVLSIPSICKEARLKLFSTSNGTAFLKKHYGQKLQNFPEVQAKLVTIS